MANKLDKQKVKQQLFHSSICMATIFVSMTYLQYMNNWTRVGRFWETLILPIVFTGEILEVILSNYYGSEELISNKQKQKRSNYFAIKEILFSLVVHILVVSLYSLICIILGAPVLQSYEQTFVLSLLLTITTVSPTIFLLGASGSLQFCFCEKPDFITKSEETALELFKYSASGSIIGAWAGSIVAPLDWDRQWQEYPIPNVLGALLGVALGNMYICTKVLYATVKVIFTKKYV